MEKGWKGGMVGGEWREGGGKVGIKEQGKRLKGKMKGRRIGREREKEKEGEDGDKVKE